MTTKEFWIFMKLSIPAIFNCFGGWFIFELQVTPMCAVGISVHISEKKRLVSFVSI